MSLNGVFGNQNTSLQDALSKIDEQANFQVQEDSGNIFDSANVNGSSKLTTQIDDNAPMNMSSVAEDDMEPSVFSKYTKSDVQDSTLQNVNSGFNLNEIHNQELADIQSSFEDALKEAYGDQFNMKNADGTYSDEFKSLISDLASSEEFSGGNIGNTLGASKDFDNLSDDQIDDILEDFMNSSMAGEE